MKYYIIVFASMLLLSCTSGEKQTTQQPQAKVATHYGRNLDNMAHIITYDVYGQKIADGMGVYIAPDIVVTTFDFVKGAFSAKMNKMESRQAYNVFGFVAYDISDNVVALRVGKRIQTINPIDTLDNVADTLYTLSYRKGKTLRTMLTSFDGLGAGTPMFNSQGNIAGIADGNGDVVSADKIRKLASNLADGHENIYDLRLKTNKVYPHYSGIRGFKIMTNMGNITLRLYNETPEYRDNFIRLVCDNFYDSLLIHRVLPNYLIQTGAADSKHAKSDDVVGWQGPGYKLPMHLVKGLYHRRGVVSASKLPSDHNASNRSDGSQFFIVAGRKFTDTELNEIERDYGKHFSPQQRDTYKNIGGAPYLDGDYTIFGEVIAGMDVVDRIAAVKLNGDRPVNDIRIKKIQLLTND